MHCHTLVARLITQVYTTGSTLAPRYACYFCTKKMPSTLANFQRLSNFAVQFALSSEMDAEVATVAAAVLCAITQYNYLYIKNKKEIKKKWKKRMRWITATRRTRTSTYEKIFHLCEKESSNHTIINHNTTIIDY